MKDLKMKLPSEKSKFTQNVDIKVNERLNKYRITVSLSKIEFGNLVAATVDLSEPGE